MSAKVLFACSKCLSRHPFEELSTGRQLCKSCRNATSLVKCTYCRVEFQPATKAQIACKKCEHNVAKYGKPSACECCKIVAAFGGTKCFRCASYEAKYGPPVQCEQCKQRAAFDKKDENKKVNGKLLCWLCTSAFKRALLKAQQEGRIAAKKRPHEKTRDSTAGGAGANAREISSAAKKSSRHTAELTKGGVNATSNAATGIGGGGVGVGSGSGGGGGGGGGGGTGSSSSTGLDLPEKIARLGPGNGVSTGNGAIGLVTTSAPSVVNIDPHSTDHVVVMTNLKEKIASLEKRLQFKDKELLEKDKLLTEIKGKNFEKENEMRNKIKEIERLNSMKVENLNRKVAALLKEIAALKKGNKKNSKRDNPSPSSDKSDKEDKDDERDEKESVFSSSNSPITN